MANMDTTTGLYQLFGKGNQKGWDAIDRLLDNGADLSALGGEGNAGFNLGMSISSWLDEIDTGARNNIIIMGDSNTSHVPGADAWRWSQKIKGDLCTLTGLDDGGEGFRHLGLSEWAKTGVWTTTADTGLDTAPNGFGWSAADANQVPVFTWTRPGTFSTFDRFDIFAIDDDFLGQDGQYRIDGGAWTATDFQLGGGSVPRLAADNVVSNVATTLDVRPPANGFPFYFAGAAFYNGTGSAGTLCVHNLGMGGGQLDMYCGETTANRLEVFDNLAPKLTLVWTGTNEHGVSVAFGLPQMTLERFYSQYTRVAQKAKAHGDCILIYPHDSDRSSETGWTPAHQPIPQDDYERVARMVAYENDCGFFSVRQAWGDFDRADARGYMSDGAHLSTTGSTQVERMIYRMIQRNS